VLRPSDAQRLTLNEAIALLEEDGWVVERCALVDEDGMPVRVYLRMRYGPVGKGDVL